MGNCCKKQEDRYEDVDGLAAQTCFNVEELENLYELFKSLSSSIVDDGLISQEEFLYWQYGSIRRSNLFSDRMFHMFNSKHDGQIDFGEFARSLSIFHPKAAREDKVSFAFQLYDTQQTGYIEPEEVKELILAFLDESDLILLEDVIEAIIDKTFKEADSKGDGKIDLEEWTAFVDRNPSSLKNMSLPYLLDIRKTFPSIIHRKSTEF